MPSDSRDEQDAAILRPFVHPYDPTFPATVAVVIPVVFVLIAVDLGLLDKHWGPRASGVLLMVVVLLLCAEALCLYAIHDRRPLSNVDQAVVALAFYMAGGLIFLRVAAPLIVSVEKTRPGRLVLRMYPFLALALLAVVAPNVISGQTMIVILGVAAFVLAWLLPRGQTTCARLDRRGASSSTRVTALGMTPRPLRRRPQIRRPTTPDSRNLTQTRPGPAQTRPGPARSRTTCEHYSAVMEPRWP